MPRVEDMRHRGQGPEERPEETQSPGGSWSGGSRVAGPISLPSLPRIYGCDDAVTYYRGRLKLGPRIIAVRAGASLSEDES